MSEALVGVLTTAFVYLFGMAHQYGYQQPFGFTFISLSPEKIIEAMRTGLLPAVEGIAVALMVCFLVKAFARIAMPNTAVLFPLSPMTIAVCMFFQIRFDVTYIWDLVIIIALYYLLDRAILDLIGRKLFGKTRSMTDPNFRYAQILLGALALIIIGYDEGRYEAYHIAEVDLCPEVQGVSGDYMLVGQTTDLFVCAAIDRNSAIVFRDFAYFRIPDNGSPKRFETVNVHPVKIGVLRDDR